MFPAATPVAGAVNEKVPSPPRISPPDIPLSVKLIVVPPGRSTRVAHEKISLSASIPRTTTSPATKVALAREPAETSTVMANRLRNSIGLPNRSGAQLSRRKPTGLSPFVTHTLVSGGCEQAFAELSKAIFTISRREATFRGAQAQNQPGNTADVAFTQGSPSVGATVRPVQRVTNQRHLPAVERLGPIVDLDQWQPTLDQLGEELVGPREGN